MAWCILCNRRFGSKDALEQHARDSPAHSRSYDCDRCDRLFGSKDALEQHARDSPAHSSSYDCDRCNRSFRSADALEQHIQHSSVHFLPPDTPLDRFFQSFSSFPYSPNLPPAESYARLRRFYGWRRGETESDKAWNQYQEALREEVKLWFGSEDDLGAWHALCRAVKIEPLPTTCHGCEKAVRRRYVNILDLLEWARGGRDDGGKDVQIFKNLQELREYSRSTGKIFHNNLDDSDGGNVVLRHLLRFIFRAP